jgi:adenylate cyclase
LHPDPRRGSLAAQDGRGIDVRFAFDREWLWGALAVVALAVLWSLDPGGAATRMREAAFEGLGELLPRNPGKGEVVVIDIDRESLSRLGPWPWRRSVIADLVDEAAAQKPRAVAIDVLLTGPDRRGPAALARALAAMSGGADVPVAAFQDDDIRLAEAVARAGNVALGLVLDEEGADLPPIGAPISAEASAAGVVPRGAAGLLAPFEPLATGAAGIGVLSFQEGALGRVTSAPRS